MSPILSILRAAHCRSTHHFFAVDAIPLVQTDAGKRLTGHLLRHHDRYLAGAKDPDTRFRDFQNHVVHVTDGYWGGAPRVAHKWYDRLQRYLRTDRFGDAAHAAGVLSHYFTDPMMPLHTQQCEREKVLHRPIEWSITKSYDQIYRLWQEDDLRIVFQLSDGPGWLGEAILHGARFANRKYWILLDEYDLQRGAKDPPAGLNEPLRESIAELFGLAVTGLARVMERAAADAEATRRRALPTVDLTMPTLLSAIRVPARLWLRRATHKHQQWAIEQLFHEYQRTGTLVRHLAAEVDIVHRVAGVYQDEKRWKQERAQRLASRATVIQVEKVTERSSPSAPRPVILPFRQPGPRSAVPAIGSLSRHDRLVDAPSIGPKTAARFAAIDVHTVGEFLAANAADLARRLATYWITAETIAVWQRQSALMCEVPGLRCGDAQLLAGAGFDSAAALAAADPNTIHRQVAEYAGTSSGRRYLRGAAVPTPEDIASWVVAATGNDPARRRTA